MSLPQRLSFDPDEGYCPACDLPTDDPCGGLCSGCWIESGPRIEGVPFMPQRRCVGDCLDLWGRPPLPMVTVRPVGDLL